VFKYIWWDKGSYKDKTWDAGGAWFIYQIVLEPGTLLDQRKTEAFLKAIKNIK
jgi:hypothetical protein